MTEFSSSLATICGGALTLAIALTEEGNEGGANTDCSEPEDTIDGVTTSLKITGENGQIEKQLFGEISVTVQANNACNINDSTFFLLATLSVVRSW